MSAILAEGETENLRVYWSVNLMAAVSLQVAQ